MNAFYNKHYIKTDAQGCITAGWSDGPHPERDTADAICINEKGGYQFRLTADGEENPYLCTADGIPLYRWDGQAVQPRGEAEIAADIASLPPPAPTALERLQAENALLRAQIAANADRQEFLEDCIAEMASQVYSV